MLGGAVMPRGYKYFFHKEKYSPAAAQRRPSIRASITLMEAQVAVAKKGVLIWLLIHNHANGC